jgi:predicted transcriptional regulator
MRHSRVEVAMPAPEGKLTAAQFEILGLTWSSTGGLTIGEIWDAIRSRRGVTRTTVLNLVDRLEKRGWLKRKKDQNVYRYFPTVDRSAAERQMAVDFLDDFFEGSPSNLLMSLLGSKRISKEDADSLKRLIEESRLRQPAEDSRPKRPTEDSSAAPSRKKGPRHDERS